MSRLKNFSRNLTTSYLQMGVNVVYSLASVPIILHWLPKAEFGIWAVLAQFMIYMYLMDLGINQAISRFLIDHKDQRGSGEYGALVKTSALVSAIQGIIVLALVILVSPLLSSLMRIPAEYRDTFIGLMRCQGLIVAVIFCMNPFVIMLSAHQRMDVQAWQAIMGMMLALGFLILFLAKGCGIYSFIYANAINVLISPFYYFWNCRRLGFWPGRGEWGKMSWRRFNAVFLYGKDVFLMNVGGNLASASQTIVVSRSLGLNAAATWTLGTRVMTLIRQVVYQPTGSSLPGLSEMLARGETERLAYRFKNLVGLTASLGVFLGVAYALCNSLFVGVWTADKIAWSPLNDVLLALWLFVASIQTTHGSFVFVNKQIGFLPFVFMIEGCAYILLSVFEGYRWGIPGIIVCSVICMMFFSCQFSLRKSRKFFHVSFSTLLLDWLRPALKLAALLVPLAVLLWLATIRLPVIWRLVINGVGAGICGGLLFLRFGLPPEIRHDALSRIPKSLSKGRIKQYLDAIPALKFLVPVAQFFLRLRFKLREAIATEILRWRLIRLWMVERRPLLLFVRFGGIGDILCSLPAYAAVCRANPTAQGVFVTLSAYQSLPLLAQSPGSICLSHMHCPIPRLPRWLVCQVLIPQYADELGQSSGVNLVTEFYRACGLPPERDAPPRFCFAPGRVKDVCASLNLETGGAIKSVVIHTGPSWKVREWPVEHWQILVDGLRKAVPDVRIFQIGANAYLHFSKAAASPWNVESLVGKLTLPDMAALLAGVDLFIGIDSGMIHMAVAAGTTTVGLFGPTDPGRIPQNSKTMGLWHQLPCSFCHHRQPRLHFETGCPNGIPCMKGLEPVRVLQVCLDLLNHSAVKIPAQAISMT